MSDLEHHRPTPDEALELLISGNQAYLDESIAPLDYSAARAAAIRDQEPIAGILGCGDARVAAELIFSRDPGELFMVRVAGNFLSDYGLASLEYCVEILKAPLLMVLGHTNCGAVTSALQVVREQTVLPGRLPILIDALEPSVLRALAFHPEDALNAAIQENVRRQVQRLRTISPLLNHAQEKGRLRVVGAVYDMHTGRVNVIDA
jgi:carbonic anhydrase